MDKVVNLGEFNTKGGFWRSSFIEKNPVDYFIPFLPLERSHVKMCAKVDLEKKGHPVTEQVMMMMMMIPLLKCQNCNSGI